MEKGYLYAALGESCFREAIISATSLRRVTPHAHITLVTDQDASGFYCFDSVIVKQPVAISDCQHINGRYYKITSMIESPYQQTLFLDTDTYLCDQVLEIFRLLDFCDLCMVPAPRHLPVVTIEGQELLVPTYNSGVIGFCKSVNSDAILSTWATTYQRTNTTSILDQKALAETLLRVNAKILNLPTIFNLRLPYTVLLPPYRVRILHGRPESFEDIERKINTMMIYRMWVPKLQDIVPCPA